MKIEESKITPDAPVCPHCKEKMTRCRYVGYYDGFDYWDCLCKDDEIEIEHTYRGSYA